MTSGVASRPPLPSRCSSADRSSGGSSALHRSTSVERSYSAFGKPPIVPSSSSNSVHVIGFHNNNCEAKSNAADKNSNVVIVSPMHYATPKAATKIQLVPDFHQGKHDMGNYYFLYRLCEPVFHQPLYGSGMSGRITILFLAAFPRSFLQSSLNQST